jgi:carboxylesterase type B
MVKGGTGTMYTRDMIAKAIESLTWGFPDAPHVEPEDVVDFLGFAERRVEARLGGWFTEEEVGILRQVLDMEFAAATIAAALAMDAKAGTYWYWMDIALDCVYDDAQAALRAWRRLHAH